LSAPLGGRAGKFDKPRRTTFDGGLQPGVGAPIVFVQQIVLAAIELRLAFLVVAGGGGDRGVDVAFAEEHFDDRVGPLALFDLADVHHSVTAVPLPARARAR